MYKGKLVQTITYTVSNTTQMDKLTYKQHEIAMKSYVECSENIG
jgi:hypothetical protein